MIAKAAKVVYVIAVAVIVLALRLNRLRANIRLYS